MSIYDFFKKKKATQSELSEQWKQIQQRKSGLTDQAAEIRRDALKKGIDGFSAKLNEIRDELELLAAAESEVERMMRELLASEISEKHSKLPLDRADYKERYDLVSGQAGELLGRSMSILRAIGDPWAVSLAEIVSEAFEKKVQCDAYRHQVPAFINGFAQAGGEALEVENFGTWRSRLAATEKLSPGSPEAEKWIDGRVKVLLYKPAPVVPPAPAAPKIPFPCTVD